MRTTSDKNKKFADFIANNYPKNKKKTKLILNQPGIWG
jgi:hypothetical protein